MSIETIFAHVSCASLDASVRWYEKLFRKPPIRRPMPRLPDGSSAFVRIRDPAQNLVMLVSAKKT